MKFCKQCGKMIPQQRRSNAVYCSKHCQRNALVNKQKASEMTKRLAPIRLRKLFAHDFHCAICKWGVGMTLFDVINFGLLSNGLELHHINPVSKGGSDEWNNIIPLCPNCHFLANNGLIKNEELLHNLVSEQQLEKVRKILKNQCIKANSEITFEKMTIEHKQLNKKQEKLAIMFGEYIFG